MMVIGDLHVSCKLFWSSKRLKWIFFNLDQFHCPHPADELLIISSDHILTEDLQPTTIVKLKTQEITDATNALTKTI